MKALSEFDFGGFLDRYDVSSDVATLRLVPYVVGSDVDDLRALTFVFTNPEFGETDVKTLEGVEIDYVLIYAAQVQLWAVDSEQPFEFVGTSVDSAWTDFETADYRQLLKTREWSWDKLNADLVKALQRIDDTRTLVRELRRRAELKAESSPAARTVYEKQIDVLRRVERKLDES